MKGNAQTLDYKRQLIELARTGASKPSRKELLGRLLVNYRNRSGTTYDEEFTNIIYELRPDWSTLSSDRKKEDLIRLATLGRPAPRMSTPLGVALRRYVNPKHPCYDATFHESIKEIRPLWFSTASTTTLRVKQRIATLAETGKPKPSLDTAPYLYRMLNQLTRENHSTYDREFHHYLKELRPEWFTHKVRLTPVWIPAEACSINGVQI